MSKPNYKHGRCKACGAYKILAHHSLQLCRLCHGRKWRGDHPNPRYRKATLEERLILDEANAKLQIAFFRGDWHTYARAAMVLDSMLKKLREPQ